jgi:serine/threonine-protein kinase HipA
MRTNPVKEIRVGLQFDQETMPVGRLAASGRTVFFAYDQAFLTTGLEISPLRLPLKPGLQSFRHDVFDGLPGVFGDSLPDGWGRLLIDRAARAQGFMPDELSVLERLAHVGGSGMGALVYEPDVGFDPEQGSIDLDLLAEGAQHILAGEASELLDVLISLNGSSAGARPKAMLGIDAGKCNLIHGSNDLPENYDHWIVKFGNTQDGADAGAVEYIYSIMARDAGLELPEAHLFPSRVGAGYFGVERFDRSSNKRLHLHSVAGLLNADFRMPTLDYRDLAALTLHLTRDMREVGRLVRLAVFNVLAHNRDDHAKNFSFLMDANGNWSLSPAYDLTFSSGPGGQQSMMVMGEGLAVTERHLIDLGVEAGLERRDVEIMIDQTNQALSRWSELASEYGVRHQTAKFIQQRLDAQRKG